jgi:hypothetical protein
MFVTVAIGSRNSARRLSTTFFFSKQDRVIGMVAQLKKVTEISTIGVRNRGRGPPFPPIFLKTMEIRANARKNQENSGRFIRKWCKKQN